jgi:hypothetical protein
MIQISYSSINDEYVSSSRLMRETEKSQWAGAKPFVPRLFQKKKDIQTEKEEQIYCLEDVLNISGIGKKSMITKFLSDVDLYFLQQVSKSILNALHDEFMKKLKKEQKKKRKH